MTALVKHAINPRFRFPRRLIQSGGFRETVAVIIVDRVRNAVPFIHPVKADEETFIPPQGGVRLPKEPLQKAARRESREELPSIRRLHRHAQPLVNWSRPLYLGSFINEQARSGWCKRIHFVAFASNQRLRLQPDGAECDRAEWVAGVDQLHWCLRSTLRTNPAKAHAIEQALRRVVDYGWLQ